MVLGMLPGTARAACVAHPVTGGYLYFNQSSGTIIDCDDTVTEAAIPSEIAGYTVRRIGPSAFIDCANLTDVTIPSSVTEIGNTAFYGCTSLTSIVIPDSVTTLGIAPFWGCSALRSVTIPGSVESVEYDTFMGCEPENVVLGTGLKSIGYNAFRGNRNLISVTIPNTVTSINSEAFAGASSLGSISIPDSVTSIGSDVFSGCTSLKNVSIPGSVGTINGMFHGSSVENVNLGSGITSIGSYAFSDLKTLKSVSIPSTVTNIGTYAFYNSGLTSVTIPDGVTTISAGTFRYCNDLSTVSIPSSVTEIGFLAFSRTGITSIVIPDGVTTIGESAFLYCSSLTTVGIPASLTTIKLQAFWGCDSIANVNYDGTNEQVKRITVEQGNDNLIEAVWNSDKPDYVLDSEYSPYEYTEPTEPTDPMELTEPTIFKQEAPESEVITEPTEPSTEPTEPSTETSEKPTEPSTEDSTEPSTEPSETPWTPPVPSGPTQPSAPDPSEAEDEPETDGSSEAAIPDEIVSPIQYILKEEEGFVEWIDRVDLPDYAVDFYTALCIGGDNDSFSDILINDDYHQLLSENDTSSTAAEPADVESAQELVSELDVPYSSGEDLFQGSDLSDIFAVVDTVAGDRAINYSSLKEGDVVRTTSYNGIFITKIRKDGNANFEEDKKVAAAYASTAFQAFDRDHPEVFWLSGKNKLRLVTVTMKDGSETYKETYIFFVLADADGFTVRDPLYPDQASIEAAIARRDAAVETILSTVTATAPNEQAAQLNRWLTEHNHYNTSEDLYSISNAPHECLSALEGNIGTSGPVCDGYARAFKVLCDKLKIPCVLVDGYALTKADGPGEFHMWNSVQIDDQWYGVDVTWNDPTVKGIDDAKSGHEREDFLLVGADTVVFGLKFSESHPPKNRAANGGVAFVNGPSLSTEAFNPLAGFTVLPFEDVPLGSWYYDAVEYVFSSGLMTGETAAAFSPDGPMTRAMVWTVLARMAGADVSGGTPWYAPAQAWAVGAEVSDGSNPGGNISREELVAMLWRAQGSPDAAADLSGFADSGAVSGWAAEAVRWAVSTGLLEGSDGRIDPASRAARAEVAALLMRFQGTLAG